MFFYYIHAYLIVLIVLLQITTIRHLTEDLDRARADKVRKERPTVFVWLYCSQYYPLGSVAFFSLTHFWVGFTAE